MNNNISDIPEFTIDKQPIKNYWNPEIHECLVRLKENSWNSSAKWFFDSISKIDGWLKKADIKILEEVLLNSEEQSGIIHVNINPLTILDENYYLEILRILLMTKKKTANFVFEIIEVNWEFDEKEVYKLNSRLLMLKESFSVKICIDDYPYKTNDVLMLEYMKCVDIIKINKKYVLEYSNWKISKKVFIKVMKDHLSYIKKYFWKIPIIIEWVETKEVFELIVKNFIEIEYFQWFYFWKEKEIRNILDII